MRSKQGLIMCQGNLKKSGYIDTKNGTYRL